MPLVAVKPNPDGTIPVAPTENQPLLVDANTGRLLVDTEANLTADLSSIESKQDTTNGILTAQAADLAAVKTQLATGTIAVTGGGGGGSGASAAYNATLPTYTSGASTTLQTDVNGRLITTGPELQTISTEAVAIDNKLPALSSGRVPVEADASPAQTFTYNNTGALAANAVVIDTIDCSQYKELTLHAIALGTGGNGFTVEVSNNATNWLVASVGAAVSSTLTGTTSQIAGTMICYPTYGAKFARVRIGSAVTSGTTTCVLQANQIPTPKTIITGTVSLAANSQVIPTATTNTGYGVFHSLVSAASTNATNVKNTQGQIGSLVLSNNSASLKWVRLFNSGTAPTVGTSTPVLNYPLQPNSTIDLSTSCAGLRFTSGISYAITGGAASAAVTDSVSVAAGDVTVNMIYA